MKHHRPPEPIVLPETIPESWHDYILTEYRTTTRDEFCAAFGLTRYLTDRIEKHLRYALPNEWAELTFFDKAAISKRSHLSPYQAWVLHAVATEKRKVASWDDYARLIPKQTRPDGTHVLSFSSFLEHYPDWADAIVSEGKAKVERTCPQLWDSLRR